MAAVLEKTKEIVKDSVDDVAWYHFGLIPASGKVLMPMPSEKNGFPTMQEFDTYSLWSRDANLALTDEGDISIFVSKVRQFNTLPVRGFSFHSFSECVEINAGQLSRFPFPGNAIRLTEREAKAIADSAWRHFVRFPLGVSKMGEPQKAEVHDMAFGSKPDNFSDAEWREYRLKSPTPILECPKFNPRTDKFVAEFVYLTKLDKDPYDRDFVESDYIRNPNRYHQRIVTAFSREFFENPPKSVAETYPKPSA